MNALPQEIRVAIGIAMLLLCISAIVWLLVRFLRRSYDPARLLFRWAATIGVAVLGFFAINGLAGDGSPQGKIAGVLAGAVFGVIFAILWVPAIIGKVSDWFGGLFTGGSTPPVPTPVYSIAEAKRKQGLFREAIHEIQQQLQKFPHDVTGQLMLAEIQAVDLQNLEGAALTIQRFVHQPHHGPKNLAFALNSLADWHLKLAGDTEAARQALEQIIGLLPGTEQAYNATQRLAHLVTAEDLQRRAEAGPIHLEKGVALIGLKDGVHLRARSDLGPEAERERLLAQLERHPLDHEAREKLARLLADEFQDYDQALQQFEALARLPSQTPREVARALHGVADMQIRGGADYETVHATLQRIIDAYPNLAPAELAQQRIEKLRLELKGKEKSQVVKLGSYEKDLGLKTRPKPDAG